MLGFIRQKNKKSRAKVAPNALDEINTPVPTTDLENDFLTTVEQVKNRTVQLKKEQYLKLYGLYKQMKNGDNNTTAPSVLKVIDRQKWTAWNGVKGLSKVEAKQAYIRVVFPDGKRQLRNEKESDEGVLEQTKEATEIQKKQKERVAAMLFLNGKGIQTEHSITFQFTIIGEENVSEETVLKLVPRKPIYAIPIQLEKIGYPRAIRCQILTENSEIGDWFLKNIELHLKEIDTRFQFNYYTNIQLPCTELILFESSGWLSQSETPTVKKARLVEQGILRKQFRWAENNVIERPGFADFQDYSDLPEEEHLLEKGYAINPPDFYKKESDVPEKNIDYYLEMNQNMKRVPRVAKDNLWKSDNEFGRAFLQGTHSNFIELCTEIPINLNVTADFVVSIVHQPLGTLIEEKRIFIADYKALDGIKPQEGFYNSAPIALFLSCPKTEEFLPIVIQLEQNITENSLVFTPNDGEYDWLIAKSFVRLADASYHQLISHFLMTHASVEALAVACYRILPSYHPIMQLLRPYLKHIFATSLLARKTLINPGGWIDTYAAFGGEIQEKLTKEAYKNLSLKTYTNLPKDLKNRKVNYKKTLPNYPFRDDGILIWSALEDYVRTVLKVYYKSDEMVKNDFLIQEVITEFNTKGWKYSDFPKSFENLDDLVTFFTSMIWTATALHGSMNYNQFEIYGFQPFGSISLIAPPPTEKGATEEDFLKILPGHKILSTSLNVISWLSSHFEEDIHLGNDNRIFSSNNEVRFALLKFRDQLDAVGKIIEKRNSLREVPYLIFAENHIPNSIML